MGYGSRTPTSNEPAPHQDNPWGGDELMDDFALMLNGLAKRCGGCQRVIRNKYLKTVADSKLCPDCAQGRKARK